MSDIFVHQDESGQYRVWPPVFVTGPHSVIGFRNCTDTAATITIDIPLAGTTRSVAAKRTQAGRQTRAVALPLPAHGTADLQIGAGVPGLVYGYHVAVGAFHAVGLSEPRIIID